MGHDTPLLRVQLVLLTGLISLVLAIVSGVIAYVTARSNSRRDLEKMQAQLDAQQKVTEQERVAELRQRYVTPLRYYASSLSYRLSELEGKLGSADEARVRGWFKTLKDHAAADQRRSDFSVWVYYEGIFSATTLYYTCRYFQGARNIRISLPFIRDNPVYSERLDEGLTRVRDVFSWDAGEKGIWDALQEVIGERFMTDLAMSYESMCAELDSGDPHKRGPFLRPLDFFWTQLTPEKAREIREALDALVEFLDSNDPHIRLGRQGAEGGRDRRAGGA